MWGVVEIGLVDSHSIYSEKLKDHFLEASQGLSISFEYVKNIRKLITD